MSTYRDVQAAFVEELRSIMEFGEHIEVRGQSTRELRARLIEIKDIRARYVVVPHRHNNVFASIAESMWVISGRNDLGYLGAYLKRAHEFSDDGTTWRAGYGPRLRDWNGIDQLAEVVAILRADPSSRRAVVSIFDPDRDFVSSNDIPCNNWLHFLIRDGRLDLHIAARSTDIWWGFSGINAFEWTLLLEMMAHWLDQEPGRLVFFSSSIHLYQRHFEPATQMLQHVSDTGEAHGQDDTAPLTFSTSWDDFPAELEEWMRVETAVRSGDSLDALNYVLTDPLLTGYARMIDVFWAFKRGADDTDLERRLCGIGDSRLMIAAAEYLGRPERLSH
ncbi:MULTISPECIES: thymidylate synthase [unclassified Microbacterium]|uniref:thymidylate synthase n=1 Tax=unclassified Microbacterium TaxID=2609290 RepID=UPI000EAA3270|nr:MULTISPECIES: thymidylate synthase [unclassified Microbacterium]MBT2483091.1 thymidylate synthase [Microbacterium sp. ISL-108]RKN66154.1 thymidylate synthase [Microbacterium sp. CGR2]